MAIRLVIPVIQGSVGGGTPDDPIVPVDGTQNFIGSVDISGNATVGAVLTVDGNSVLGGLIDAQAGIGINSTALITFDDAPATGASAITAVLLGYDPGDADAVAGFSGIAQITKTGAAFTGSAVGVGGLVQSGGTINFTNTVGLRAVSGAVAVSGAQTVTGGADFYAVNSPFATDLTNQYGLYVEALTQGDNNYGVYINTPTGTIADAIHVVGGRTYLGGAAVVGDGAGTFGAALTTQLNVSEAHTDVTPAGVAGILAEPRIAYTSANANVQGAVSAFSTVGAANTANWTNATGLTGMSASLLTEAGSTGVITGAAGFAMFNGGFNGASVTNQYGLYVQALTAATNNYGIYINTPTGTIADAIHVVGGRTYLGGLIDAQAGIGIDNLALITFDDAPASAAAAVTIARTVVDPGGGDTLLTGVGVTQVEATAVPFTGFAVGFTGSAFTTAGNTQNLTNTVGLRAFSAQVNEFGSGTVTGGAGYYAANALATALTNQYGVYVQALTTATNNYGVWVDTPTGTIADAIHVVGGRTYLGGNAEFDDTANATTSTGWALLDVTATNLVPNIITNRSDATTGVGGVVNTVSLIVLGDEEFTISNGLTNMNETVVIGGATATTGVLGFFNTVVQISRGGPSDLTYTANASGVPGHIFFNTNATGTVMRIDKPSIGETTASPGSVGILINNDTPAVSGTQQYGSMVVQEGQGWQTGADTSHPVAFATQVQPVQGAGALPTGGLHWYSSIDGAAYIERMRLNSAGALLVNGRALMDNRSSTTAYWSNVDAGTTSNYALNQAASGGSLVTSLNSSTRVDIGISGSPVVSVDAASGLYGADANGPALLNEASSNTNPTLIPDRSQVTTGIGGNTGNVDIIVGGNRVANFSSTGASSTFYGLSLLGSNSSGPRIFNETSSSTNPTLVPNRLTSETGIGGAAGDLSLITNAIERVNIDVDGDITLFGTLLTASGITTGGDIQLGNDQKIRFDDDGDTYITSGLDNRISVFTGGGEKVKFGPSSLAVLMNIVSQTGGGFQISTLSPDATTPNFITNKTDTTTGVGSDAAGIHLTVSGTSSLNAGVDQIQVMDGTEALPAIVGADRDSGIRFGTNTVIISTAGSDRITSTGSAITVGSAIPILPAGDNNADLGDSSSNAWRDLYLHGRVYLADNNASFIGSDATDKIQITVSGTTEVVEFDATEATFSVDIDAPGGFRQSHHASANTPSAGATATLGRGGAAQQRNQWFIMTRAGSLVEVGICKTTDRTAGTYTLIVQKSTDGGDTFSILGSLTAVIDGTNTEVHTNTQGKDISTFNAGNLLRMQVVADGSASPSTGGVIGTMTVEH